MLCFIFVCVLMFAFHNLFSGEKYALKLGSVIVHDCTYYIIYIQCHRLKEWIFCVLGTLTYFVK